MKIGTRVTVVADAIKLPLKARIYAKKVGVVIGIEKVGDDTYYRVLFSDRNVAAYLEHEIQDA